MRTETIHNLTLINTDCMEYMKGCKDNEFDLAIVDPPFGLGDKLTIGGTWAAKWTREDSAWDVKPTQEYFNELMRVSDAQIIWGGNYFSLPPSRCFLIWDKVAHMDTLADCEMAWTSFDKNAKLFKHIRNPTHTPIHLRQKPVKLYDWLLTNYAEKGQKILDTHGGSFSSAIAAHYFGVEYVGIEIDEDYFEAGVVRVKEQTKQIDLFRQG